MWYLKELSIDGLMSFGQANLFFNQGEVSVIYGKNLDVGEDKSNGSGKSAILEGVGFGITGSPLRKVKIGELVNDDCSQATVKVVLFNDGLNEEMTINRVAYRKKSSICQVFIGNGISDPVQVDNLTSTNDSNKFIAEKLGIVQEDLLNFFILMSAQFTPFLDSSDTKKKEVINRFSNGIIVDKAINELDVDIDLCNEEFIELRSSHKSLESTLEALQSTLNETIKQDNSDNELEAEKEEYSRKIEDQKKNMLILEKFNSENKFDLSEILDEIDSSASPDNLRSELEVINNNISNKKSERDSLKNDLRLIDFDINHIHLKIDGAISCPHCQYEFDATDEDFNLDDAKKDLEKLSNKRDGVVSKGKTVRKSIDDLEQEKGSLVSRINKIENKINSLKKEFDELSRLIKKTDLDMLSSKSKIESFEIKLEALSNKDSVDVVTPLRNKIKSVEAKISPLTIKLSDVETELDELTVQKDVFRRFKSYLANMSLKSMEGLVNDFLEDFGSDILVQLNSEKKLANGKSKEKIDATLVRNGVDIGSFNKRSGGEKASINLAFAKTLSHLINLNAGENRGFNLLVIDEILDATDQEGLSKIVRSFEKNSETVIMISHIPLPDSVGRHITVCKENDLSKVL